MGQRTNIILQVRYRDEKWGESIEQTRVFYCQWGIGRILPMNVMSILHNMLSTELRHKDSAAQLCPSGLQDFTDEWELNQHDLNQLSFDNPKAVGEVMKIGNNNGGILLRITETRKKDKADSETEIEYAFMLGYEEGGKYNSFVTKDKFLAKQSRYIDGEFLEMLNLTLDYYKAKDMVKPAG